MKENGHKIMHLNQNKMEKWTI